MAHSKNDPATKELRTRRFSVVGGNGLRSTEDFAAENANAAERPSESTYLGFEPGLVPVCHDVYQMKPNRARKTGIFLSNTKGSIDLDGETDIVDVIHISRGGVSFRSAHEYSEGTAVSIATHYVHGGQNIYQAGVIVDVRRKPSESSHGEYEIQFAPIGPAPGIPHQPLYVRP
jgi:hypothetical protein